MPKAAQQLSGRAGIHIQLMILIVGSRGSFACLFGCPHGWPFDLPHVGRDSGALGQASWVRAASLSGGRELFASPQILLKPQPPSVPLPTGDCS